MENQAITSGSNFPDEPSDDPDYPADDDPTITLLDGALMKVVASTNQTHTLTDDAAIGEIVTYALTLYVPPGETRSSIVTDTLTQGLAFMDCLSITADTGLTTSVTGGFDAVCSNAVVSEWASGSAEDVNQGRKVTYDFGTLGNSTAAAVPLVINYRTVVLNSLNNQDGGQVRNAVVWDYESGSLSSSAPPLNIVEPDLQIIKSADRVSASNGDIITFTLRISHTASSSADAFNLALVDPLPENLVYVPGSFTFISGTPATVDDSDATTLRASWTEFPLGWADTVLEFQTSVSGLSAGQSTTNTALLAWTSLPGDVSTPQSTHNTLSTERDYDPPSPLNIYGDSDSVTIGRPAPTPTPTLVPTPTLPASK